MERALRTLYILYPREAFQSFTTDRGKELPFISTYYFQDQIYTSIRPTNSLLHLYKIKSIWKKHPLFHITSSIQLVICYNFYNQTSEKKKMVVLPNSIP